MSKDRPTTLGTRFLDKLGIEYEPCVYRWEKGGGTSRAAKMLDFPEPRITKTLVFATNEKTYLLVLMEGTHDVSTKKLARLLGVKSVVPCDPKKAESLTGYQIGGISPFGTRTKLPVYMQETLMQWDQVCINAGHRGILAKMSPEDIRKAVDATLVDVAREKTRS